MRVRCGRALVCACCVHRERRARVCLCRWCVWSHLCLPLTLCLPRTLCGAAAAELESHAEALRQLSTEGAKGRVEAREEADTIATAVRVGQAAHAEAFDKADRSLAALRSDVRELRENGEAASAREAETLEGVLNLRTQQNAASAWMEHVQRELSSTKSEATKAGDLLREIKAETEAAKTARAAWKEEVNVLDLKLAEIGRSVEAHSAERQVMRDLTGSVEVFKREVRATFEASQHAHNRLRELVDERRGGSPGSRGGGGGATGTASGGGGMWTSDGAAAAREEEASHHAQRRMEASTALAPPSSSYVTSGVRSSAVRFTLDSANESAAEPAGGEDGAPAAAAAAASARERPRAFAYDVDLEPPHHKDPLISRVAAGQAAGRSPPLSRGPGPAAFTPSLWMTPAPARSQRLGLGDGMGTGGSVGYPTSVSRFGSSSMPPVSPALSRLEPRRDPLS